MICEGCVHESRVDLRAVVRSRGKPDPNDEPCDACGERGLARVRLHDLGDVFHRLRIADYKNVREINWPGMRELDHAPQGDSLGLLISEDWAPLWKEEEWHDDWILEALDGPPLSPEESHYRHADGGFYVEDHASGWIRRREDWIESDNEWIIDQAIEDPIGAACRHPRVLGYRDSLGKLKREVARQGLALRFGRHASAWIMDDALRRVHARFWSDIDALIVPVDAGSQFWRARSLTDEELSYANTWRGADLGAPAPKHLRQGGRANLAKQPFLYLASSEKCARKEVFKAGASGIAVAQFKLAQAVRLLDVRGTAEPLLPFQLDDEAFARRYTLVPLVNQLRTTLSHAFSANARSAQAVSPREPALFPRFLTQLLFHDAQVHGVRYSSVRCRGHDCIALFSPSDARYVRGSITIREVPR